MLEGIEYFVKLIKYKRLFKLQGGKKEKGNEFLQIITESFLKRIWKTKHKISKHFFLIVMRVSLSLALYLSQLTGIVCALRSHTLRLWASAQEIDIQ